MDKKKLKSYFNTAQFLANEFSKDKHKKVGCLLLQRDTYTILSTGINGLPRKINDDMICRWQRPDKYLYLCHAESNSIANAARNGVKIDDAICVVTMFPCHECGKLLIQSGIKTIVTPTPDYENPRWKDSYKISNELFEENLSL